MIDISSLSYAELLELKNAVQILIRKKNEASEKLFKPGMIIAKKYEKGIVYYVVVDIRDEYVGELCPDDVYVDTISFWKDYERNEVFPRDDLSVLWKDAYYAFELYSPNVSYAYADNTEYYQEYLCDAQKAYFEKFIAPAIKEAEL